jgi:tetratricopeptide (TPR) repeat protein
MTSLQVHDNGAMHPPSVVLLAPHGQGGRISPELHSPLSTAPNSPQQCHRELYTQDDVMVDVCEQHPRAVSPISSGKRPISFPVLDLGTEEGEDEEEDADAPFDMKQKQPKPESQTIRMVPSMEEPPAIILNKNTTAATKTTDTHMKNQRGSEVPFDERFLTVTTAAAAAAAPSLEDYDHDHPDDEKKVESDEDELMMHTHSQSHYNNNSNSNYHSPTLPAAGEDLLVLAQRILQKRRPSETVPFIKKTGSLDELDRPIPTNFSSLQQQHQQQPAAVLLLSKRDRPTMNRTRAKTTGDMIGRRNTANTQVLQKIEEQQHLNFSALKRDILSMQPRPPREQQTQGTSFSVLPHTQHVAFGTNTHANVTPSPKVKSPPDRLNRLAGREQPPRPIIMGSLLEANPSMMSSPSGGAAWPPSFYSTNVESHPNSDTRMDDWELPEHVPAHAHISHQKYPEEVEHNLMRRSATSKSHNETATTRSTSTLLSSQPSPAMIPPTLEEILASQRHQYLHRMNSDASAPHDESSGFSPARAAYETNSDTGVVMLASARPNSMSSRSQSVPSTNRNLPTTTNNHDWNRYLSHRGISNSATSATLAQGWLDQKQNQRKRTSSIKSNTTTSTSSTAYREMTPNKDLKNSNKSAEWLEEELRRRTTMKREINHAILATRGDNKVNETPKKEGEEDDEFAQELRKALHSLSPSHHEHPLVVPNNNVNNVIDNSRSIEEEDDEVAAITEEEGQELYQQEQQQAVIIASGSNGNIASPRRLNYEDDRNNRINHSSTMPMRPTEGLPTGSGHYSTASHTSGPQQQRQQPRQAHRSMLPPRSPSHSRSESSDGKNYPKPSSNNPSRMPAAGQSRRYSHDTERSNDSYEHAYEPRGQISDPLYPTGISSQSHSTLGSQSLTQIDLQEEMKRFASDTRAALRGKAPSTDPSVESGKNNNNNAVASSSSSQPPPLPDPHFRSIAIAHSMSSAMMGESPIVEGNSNPNTKARMMSRSGSEEQPPRMKSAMSGKPRAPARITSSGSGRESLQTHSSHASEFSELHTGLLPVLVRSMDSDCGIPKGDITISLLNENTGTEASKNSTWAGRVYGAIWRCRKMRRSMGGLGEVGSDQAQGGPARGRSSLPVDLDEARVAGGFRSVASTQEAGLMHLKHDEIDEACELFEDIIFAYYSYFERSLKLREKNPLQEGGATTDFKPYIGVALYNLGILNLLKEEFEEALSFFTRAVDNRKSCLGEGHPDHVASLVKLAICLYALNDFGGAHARLEEALFFSRKSAPSLEDRIQMAEILNNLGCLTYMCGQPVAAQAFYKESLDVQFGALSESMYGESPLVGPSISLNISITRANIGFVKLVTKNTAVAITALEAALMVR